ncbi:MAG: hypothetical protein WCC17_26085 [Candidatus Nitrosopolaris sp.]
MPRDCCFSCSWWTSEYNQISHDKPFPLSLCNAAVVIEPRIASNIDAEAGIFEELELKAFED